MQGINHRNGSLRWPVVIVGAMLYVFSSLAWSTSRFVSPLHSAAVDDGEGGAGKPYRTLSFALKQLMPGDTLNIAAGIYRDALIFPKRAWSRERPTTITGTGVVTLLGTDLVTGWQSRGDDVYVKHPWLLEPQQVVVNGAMLKQIGGTIFKGYPTLPGHELAPLHHSQGGIWPKRVEGGRDTMPPESFFYDHAQKELVIRTRTTTPIDGGVEIAMRPLLVHGQNVAGITIRNVRFRYSNTTTTGRQGAITLVGQGNTLDSLVVEDMDGSGIEVSGDGNEVRNCLVTRSGYLGIKARGSYVVIKHNEVSYNNTRGFNKWWEAGGMKFIGGGGLQASKVTNNRVHHNYGDGIWFDWGNDDNLVERNIVSYNEGFGIHYEASSRGVIQDNEVYRNSQRGVYLIHSRDSVVIHNLVAANGLEGIVAIDEQRTDPKGVLDLRPARNKVYANIIAWNKGLAVILPDPKYSNLSEANLYVSTMVEPLFAMGWPKGPFAKKTLNTWRTEQLQDRASIAMAMPMARELRAELDDGNTSPNWSTLLAVQSKLSVPIDALQSTLPQGIALTNRVGPR